MRRFSACLLLAIVCGLLAHPSQAQRPAGDTGLGVQIGEPTGLTLRFYNPGGLTYDALAAWDFSDDFFFLNIHGLYEQPLNMEAPFPLVFFYGPGAYVGARNEDVVLGVSGSFGLSLFFAPFEAFGQLTPRMDLVPDTDFDLGGGIGVRYYF